MKGVHLRAPSVGRGLLLAVYLSTIFAALPASAQTADSFLETKYNLGKGGQQVSLEAVTEAPLIYFRSAQAYASFRAHIASKIGRQSLSETDFLALVESGQLRDSTLCEGMVDAAGLSDGAIAWGNPRNCYEGERLIEALVAGHWIEVAAAGCYNPTRDIPPAKPSGRYVCRMVPQGGEVVETDRSLRLGAVWHPGCNCYRKPQLTPSLTLPDRSTASTGGVFRQCVWVENEPQ